jgi:hypothetical protein
MSYLPWLPPGNESNWPWRASTKSVLAWRADIDGGGLSATDRAEADISTGGARRVVEATALAMATHPAPMEMTTALEEDKESVTEYSIDGVGASVTLSSGMNI